MWIALLSVSLRLFLWYGVCASTVSPATYPHAHSLRRRVEQVVVLRVKSAGVVRCVLLYERLASMARRCRLVSAGKSLSIIHRA